MKALKYFLICLIPTSVAHAQVLVGPNDGSDATALFSGVNASNNYLFAIAPDNASNTTVNDVTFTSLSTTPGFSSNFDGNNAGSTAGPFFAFQYKNGGVFTATTSFSGLTAGDTYSLVFYNAAAASYNPSAPGSADNNRGLDITTSGFTADVTTPVSYNEDLYAPGSPDTYTSNIDGFHTLTFNFTAASSSVDINFANQTLYNGFQFYGATLQDTTGTGVVPEPSASILVLCGALGLGTLCRFRKLTL